MSQSVWGMPTSLPNLRRDVASIESDLDALLEINKNAMMLC